MMNNEQLHHQINASPTRDTVLARLLKRESNDTIVVDVLFARVLGRRPSDTERNIVEKHVESIDHRGQAFEDVLWSLLNSTEFTTRK